MIVLAPHETESTDVEDADIVAELRTRINAGLSKRDAVNEVTNALGIPRNRVYTLSVSL